MEEHATVSNRFTTRNSHATTSCLLPLSPPSLSERRLDRRRPFDLHRAAHSIAAGGTGSVNVMISGAGESLNVTGFQFLITPNSPTTTQLAFVNPQADSELSNPNYVFAGHSADFNLPLPVGNVTSTNFTNDTFTGGDNYDPTTGSATVTSSVLLVTLDLTTRTGMSPSVGDSFSIALLPNNFTLFLDPSLNSIAYTSTPGTVTIIKAVPEPASMAILGSGCLLLGGFRRLSSRRRRQTVPTQDAHAA